MLIARIHSVVSLYRINGSQHGYTANVINFKQNIEDYINVLPMLLHELTSTLVFNKYTKAGITQFRVRKYRTDVSNCHKINCQLPLSNLAIKLHW